MYLCKFGQGDVLVTRMLLVIWKNILSFIPVGSNTHLSYMYEKRENVIPHHKRAFIFSNMDAGSRLLFYTCALTSIFSYL